MGTENILTSKCILGVFGEKPNAAPTFLVLCLILVQLHCVFSCQTVCQEGVYYQGTVQHMSKS